MEIGQLGALHARLLIDINTNNIFLVPLVLLVLIVFGQYQNALTHPPDCLFVCITARYALEYVISP